MDNKDMQFFIRETRSEKDFILFDEELKTWGNPNKIARTQKIINTQLPVLAIPSPILKEIAKEIFQGDYRSFLDHMPHNNHEATMIDAYLISKIKDFSLQKYYIEKLADFIDNRATVDCLKFAVKGNEKSFFTYACELIHSPFPFKRRIGIRIFFSFLQDQAYFPLILKELESLQNEEHYYVNMASAWLLCECLIGQEKETLMFLKTTKMNDFVINKAISKARDSFRISQEMKEELLLLKR